MSELLVLPKKEITVDRLVDEDNLILSKETYDLMEFTPFNRYLLDGTEFNRRDNMNFLLDVGFSSFISFITIENSIYESLIIANGDLELSKKLISEYNNKNEVVEKVNKIVGALRITEPIQENKDPFKVMYEIKINGMDMCNSLLNFLTYTQTNVGKDIIAKSNGQFQNIQKEISNDQYISGYVYGSYVDFTKKIRPTIPGDIDGGIIVKDLDYKTFFKEATAMRKINGLKYAPNILLADKMKAISFFSYNTINEKTDFLKNNFELFSPSIEYKKSLIMVQLISSLIRQRKKACEDISVMDEYLKNYPDVVKSRIKMHETYHKDLAREGFNFDVPKVGKKDYRSNLTAIEAKRLIAESSIGMENMLLKFYSDYRPKRQL